MRLLKRFTCKAIGHEPNYFQARSIKDGRWAWKNYARGARCAACSASEPANRIRTVAASMPASTW